jgi:sirohydrochlorin ferrochelatase
VDVEAVAAALAQRRDAPVSVGFLSAQGPGVAEALTAAGPGPVTVATYLLAPGYFADRLNGLAVEHGAAHLTEALAPHPLLAELVLRRFEHHLQQDHVGPAPVGGGGRATDRSRLIDLDRTDGTGAG